MLLLAQFASCKTNPTVPGCMPALGTVPAFTAQSSSAGARLQAQQPWLPQGATSSPCNALHGPQTLKIGLGPTQCP